VDRDLCHLIFDGLTAINDRGEPEANLAQGWTISEDGRTYIFQLRDNVHWHDGAPFTVEDVLFTIRAIQDPDYAGPKHLASFWREIDVEPLSMFTVQFELPQPFAPFLSYASIGILPVHLIGDVPASELPAHPFNRAPVGTGSWQFGMMDEASIRLDRNPNHFRHDPYLDHVRFNFYPTHQSALEACRAGETLGTSRVLPDNLPQVWDDEALELHSAPLASLALIFLNTRDPIFRDQEVRQALWYATDRQAVIDRLLKGQGVVAHSPIMPFSWAYDPSLERYDYDRHYAGWLLELAGWELRESGRYKDDNPLRFKLTVSNNSLQVAIAQALKAQWSKVGIEAVIEVVSADRLGAEYLVPRRYQAVLYEWRQLPADPDLYPLWHSTQVGRGGQNFAGIQDEELDEALEKGRLISDQATRKRWYDRFQQRFATLAPSLPLYYPVYDYVVSTQVGNVTLGPLLEPAHRFRTLDQWYVNIRRVPPEEAEELATLSP
jgi:peptide/nickel transport system substrate-binding protein